MAAFPSAPDTCLQNTEKQRRTRKTHRKVRSGCLTCKIRRKKCDEAKPSCLRCTSTGRTCDGYNSSTSTIDLSTQMTKSTRPASSKPRSSARELPRTGHVFTADTSSALSRIPNKISMMLGSLRLTSEVDMLCFDYFRQMTAPQLGSYHNSDILRTFAIRSAFQYPAIMKAAAAVGAAHRRHDLGISREAFTYCEISARLFAEAKRSLAQYVRTNQGSQDTHDVEFVVCILHGVFEVFQGNFDQAVRHMTQGVKAMWNRPTSFIGSDTKWHHAYVHPQLFSKLYQQLGSYAQQVSGRLPRILTDYRIEPMPPMPLAFESLEQGLDLIFTQAHYLLQTPASIWEHKEERQRLQALHVARIRQWCVTLAETSDGTTMKEQGGRKKHALLRRSRSVTYLLLYMVLFVVNDPNIAAVSGEDDWDLTFEDTSTEDIDVISPTTINDNYGHGSITSYDDDRRNWSKRGRPSTFNSYTSSNSDLAIESPRLWNLVNRDENLLANVSCITKMIDALLSNDDVERGHDSAVLSLNFDTGFGPPRSNIPSPDGSSKTAHMVRTLLDPESREKIASDFFANHTFTPSSPTEITRSSSSDVDESSPPALTFSSSTSTSSSPSNTTTTTTTTTDFSPSSCTTDIPAKLCCNEEGNVTATTNKKAPPQRAYAIAEQICAIEEHAVLGAANAIFVIPRGLKPKWLDVSYYLEERRVRVRYCTRDDGSLGVAGAPGGMLWAQEWLKF